MNKYHYIENKHCIDCNKLITDTAMRCHSCASKGNLSYNYIDGRTNKKPYCIDCHKEIFNYQAKRCVICSKQKDLNPNWRGGKPHCITCGKELSIRKVKNYEPTQCQKCYLKNNKGKNHPMFGVHKLGDKAPNWKGGFPVCLDCSKKLKDYNSIRCQKCFHKFYSGKKHPMWAGGTSKLPYSFDFTKELKNLIRKRDNYTCQLCHIKEKNLKGVYKILTPHHIDYCKQNCKEDNLISLCNSCNSKVNFNRDYWYAYFTYLLAEEIKK